MALDKSKTSIYYLRMEPASNGFIISYSERVEKPGKGQFDNCQYLDRKEVFDVDDGDQEENDLEKAFARFKELALRQYSEMKMK